jgi:hypothetical protein
MSETDELAAMLPAPTADNLAAHMGEWHPDVADRAGWAHHEDHRYLNAGHVHEFGDPE